MITGFVCLRDNSRFRKLASLDDVKNLQRNEDEILWLDFYAPNQEEWKLLEDPFHFHPLTIEDCMNQDQRPKIEDYGDYLFIVSQWAMVEDDELKTHELDIYVGKNFVVTVHDETIPAVQINMERCEKNTALPARGTDFLLYMILDSVVDHYFPLLEEMDDRIDTLEDEVVNNPGRGTLNNIFQLKQTLSQFRRLIVPQRELFSFIMGHQYALIHTNMFVYFRDVYDHVLRIYEMIEFERDQITSCLEVYLSSISNRMNEIMKTLTVIATVFMPLTFLTGMLGMNFSKLPYLGWDWEQGFEFFFLMCVAITLSMILVFKRKKWF